MTIEYKIITFWFKVLPISIIIFTVILSCSEKKIIDLDKIEFNDNIKRVVANENGPIILPKLLSQIKLSYPKLAKEMNVEAKVFTMTTITKDGTVDDVEILKIYFNKNVTENSERKLHQEFSEATISTLKQQKFSPGLYKGQKIKVRMDIPVRYRL
ncbi:MAG: hypothetical protein CVV44_05790 [Spirochaetae bacterium HGW-Spirochaetae-1]|jgi:hypothetical protein|nr:MAG: hypothetical protein CVV44_05790 [Spirochaetae bacterium HGW-Spirochaetae-1]